MSFKAPGEVWLESKKNPFSLDSTPHRQLGLPSLIEGMIPAKVVKVPARDSNQPLTSPIDDASSSTKAAAADLMRRRRTILGGETTYEPTSGTTLYTATPR